MNPVPKPTPLSPPFAHRELNGEQMLEELKQLRAASVPQKVLNDCALAVRSLPVRGLLEAMTELKQLSGSRFVGHPELAKLLSGWAAKVKGPRDLAEMCLHFQRLAIASGLLTAMYRGASRLPAGARKR